MHTMSEDIGAFCVVLNEKSTMVTSAGRILHKRLVSALRYCAY
jgi:hypothetical protein